MSIHFYSQAKPVIIPERPKEKKSQYVPDFVRNVMGSSAGAGSGEFHVYRHLRRKEYGRQKAIAEMSEKVTDIQINYFICLRFLRCIIQLSFDVE